MRKESIDFHGSAGSIVFKHSMLIGSSLLRSKYQPEGNTRKVEADPFFLRQIMLADEIPEHQIYTAPPYKYYDN
jgi:hypothetical protein